MIKIGHININNEVSLPLSHSAMLRQGHFEVLHMMGYMKHRHNSILAFDPCYPNMDHSKFQECYWRDFHEGAVEAIPPNALSPRGKEVDLQMFVDSNHAGNKWTRRSRTGFLVCINISLINWYSKKQSTVNISVFGAECITTMIGLEMLHAIQYKLRMISIPIPGPSYIYGNNMLVIHNTSKPELMLKKKYNSIDYHAIG